MVNLKVQHRKLKSEIDRELLQAFFSEGGIASAICYPISIHHQEFFCQYSDGRPLPVNEQVATRVLPLPIYPELTGAQIDRVVKVAGST